MKTHIECHGCDAAYNVSHDLDPHYYNISHCTFCGETLNKEDDGFDLEEFEEDE
jgi:hypothetical protein